MTTTGTAKKVQGAEEIREARDEPSCPEGAVRERKSGYGLGTEIALLFAGIGLKKDIPELRTYGRQISNRKRGLKARR